MNLNEFITQVHQNAVEHGWWESERSSNESITLIHSEWSEAIEEARAGRPMVWYACKSASEPDTPCMKEGCGDYYDGACEIDSMGAKPEGIAVELMDGVIRIFDLYGKYGLNFSRTTSEQLIRASKQANPLMNRQTPLVDIVAAAHSLTAKAGDLLLAGYDVRVAMAPLEACAGLVMWWVQAQDHDPADVLREKHEYNLTRPYKHGKRF